MNWSTEDIINLLATLIVFFIGRLQGLRFLLLVVLFVIVCAGNLLIPRILFLNLNIWNVVDSFLVMNK